MGRQVVVAANIELAVIRGVPSQRMLLNANCRRDRQIALLTVNRPVSNGTAVA